MMAKECSLLSYYKHNVLQSNEDPIVYEISYRKLSILTKLSMLTKL